MRPERRFKPGMEGGLRTALWISPPHHLRTAEFLSKRWGPPQNVNFVGTRLPEPTTERSNGKQEVSLLFWHRRT